MADLVYTNHVLNLSADLSGPPSKAQIHAEVHVLRTVILLRWTAERVLINTSVFN